MTDAQTSREAAGGSPTDLRTEHATDPLGVDEPAPWLSWRLPGPTVPAAVQVVVRDADGAAAGSPVVWDSGRVPVPPTGRIAYAGERLRPARRYSWAVRAYPTDGPGDGPGGWSEPASFETGLLAPGDWRGAGWIGRALPAPVPPPEACPEPLFRKRFDVPAGRVRRARLYLAGLGYGYASLAGVPVSARVLDPAPTDYARTVLYTVDDVTHLVHPGGPNVLAVRLGRGRYAEPTPNVWRWHAAPWWDQPKLLALLVVQLVGGQQVVVPSDTSWRAADGPTRSDSLYAGESFDARLARPGWPAVGYDDAAWPPAVPAAGPTGRLRAQQVEPIEIVDAVAPTGVAEPAPGVFVVDLGVQLAGFARLTTTGPAGTQVRLTYGERLHADGTVDVEQRHVAGQIQTDRFVLAGTGEPETFTPRYTYKGFRYVQVDGLPAAPAPGELVGLAAHTAVASIGEFDCSEGVLNRLHANTRRAILNNLHGVPTDTPVFEKNGWTGDAHLSAGAAALNFSMARCYTKWLRDMADAQDAAGLFPPIVPTPGWGRAADAAIRAPIPAWDVAYVEIAWLVWLHAGDDRVLAEHYDRAARYLDHMIAAVAPDGVVRCGLGDWLPPGSPGIPPEGAHVAETAYLHRFVGLLDAIAGVLGREADRTGYADVERLVAAGFRREFYDPATATCHGHLPTGYRQGPNVLGLAFGLVPPADRERAYAALVADIHARDDHLDTGCLATKLLLPLLTEHGDVDLAYRVVTTPTYPSYGHWLSLGATALYEMWEATSRSRDHHFFGSVDQWLFEQVAGLQVSGPAWSQARVRPAPPTALDHAAAAVCTGRGRVAVAWHRDGDRIVLDVQVPIGCTARVGVPVSSATVEVGVAGTPPAGAPAVAGHGVAGGYAEFEVPAGRYTFDGQ